MNHGDQLSVLQISVSFYVLQLVLLKAVFVVRTLSSRDIIELVTDLCSVCKQWTSAFDSMQRQRVNALFRCKLHDINFTQTKRANKSISAQ